MGAGLAACERSAEPARVEPTRVEFVPGAPPSWSGWQLAPRDLLAQALEPAATPWTLSFVSPEGFDERAPVSGLAAPEAAGPGSFAWAIGEHARLPFQLDRRKSLRLEIRARPFVFPGASAQRVVVALNGTVQGDFELAPGPGDYTIELPAAALRPGWNEISLDHAWAAAPRDVLDGSRDPRRLAAAYERIRLVESGPSLTFGEATIGDQERALALAQNGSGTLSWAFLAPRGSTLEVSWVAPPVESGPVTLRASIETDGEHRVLWEETVATDGASGRRSASLDDLGGRPVRLHLELAGAPPDAPWIWSGLRLARAPDPEPVAAPSQPGLNVLVVILDAARRASFGTYGGPDDTTPQIDALARDSLVFDLVQSAAPYTLSSTTSLFTSLLPPQHGVMEKEHRLAEGVPTLAETLRAAGYATAAFTANGFVSDRFGLTRGFETFVEMYRDRREDPVVRADDFHGPVMEWLRPRTERARSGERPFFLYLHYVQPHEPYDVAPDSFYDLDPNYDGPVDGSLEMLSALYAGELELTPRDADHLRRLYEGNLRYADAAVGRLVDELEALGLLQQTLVVVTSDHGEALGERGLFGHNDTVDETMTAVPLVVRLPESFPGRRAGRSPVPVSTIDLAPLLLEAAGIQAPEAFRGRSPLRYALAGTEPPARLLYARTPGAQPQIGLWSSDWKCALGPGLGLAGPPNEVDGGSPQARARTVSLALCRSASRALEAPPGHQAEAAGSLSEHERATLKALGYLRD